MAYAEGTRWPSNASPIEGRRRSNLYVLLGCDYAGKSSAMRYLASTSREARFVSYDESFVVPEDRAWVQCLKKEFFRRLSTSDISTEFKIDPLATIVDYLSRRTQCHEEIPVVIDGYYYKLLSKCALFGLADPKVFSLWRTLPAPREIIFFDIEPEVAWHRSNEGRALNPFEHYTADATPQTFRAFQRDLRERLLREVGPLPVRMIDAGRDPEEVGHQVQKFIFEGAHS